MSVCLEILQTIIDEEEPITTYKISKLLNKPFNTVKYNIKKLERYNAILVFKKIDTQYIKAVYYIPNNLFIGKDVIVKFIEPIIKNAKMGEADAKFKKKELYKKDQEIKEIYKHKIENKELKNKIVKLDIEVIKK